MGEQGVSTWNDENRWYARLMKLAHELAMEGRGEEAQDLRVAATHARNYRWLRELAAAIEAQQKTIDKQRRTIECLMVGMPDDGTTPAIRRIAAMKVEIERLRADAERRSHD